MKHYSSIQKRRNPQQGFTLVETVIAMGIIAVMITAFLAAFGPAVTSIRKSISSKEVNRLATSLEYEMSIVREDEVNTSDSDVPDNGEYRTAFEKSFEWIKNSGSSANEYAVLIYQYRGNPDVQNKDGTLKALEMPLDKDKTIPGVDYVLQSAVRYVELSKLTSDPEDETAEGRVKAELSPGVVEGRVFLVRMSQLIFNSDGALIETTNPDEIVDPRDPHTPKKYADYPEAVIAFQAKCYVLKSSIYAYLSGPSFTLEDDNGDKHPDATGKPIFTRNMAVRR